MSMHQYDLLAKIGPDFIVVMTDRDKVGQSEAERLREHFGQQLVVAVYDKSWVGKDPADLEPWQRRQMFDSALQHQQEG
jgi:GTP-binding protein EngB required for normal cell division